MTASPGVPATTEPARCPATVDARDDILRCQRPAGHGGDHRAKGAGMWDDDSVFALTPGVPVTAPDPESARCGATSEFPMLQGEPANVFRCDREPGHGGDWHDGGSSDPSQPLARAAWPVVPSDLHATMHEHFMRFLWHGKHMDETLRLVDELTAIPEAALVGRDAQLRAVLDRLADEQPDGYSEAYETGWHDALHRIRVDMGRETS